MVSCEQLANYCQRLSGFHVTADPDDRRALGHSNGGPRRQPALRMMNHGKFGGGYTPTVKVGSTCSCGCSMVKGEGAQKQRTHTPSTRKCTHRHTVGTEGSRNFKGLGSFGFFFSFAAGYGARSEVKCWIESFSYGSARYCSPKCITLILHGTTSTATGPAAPCQN